MQTTHEIRVGDARSLEVPDDSVELVVTSPPYPMVEMWDDCFREQDPAIGEALEAGDGDAAFERMHAILDDVWERIAAALRPGGIAAINVGDATRRLGGTYRLYPNHTRIVEGLSRAGLVQLPGIVWRKPTNSTAKFMGSGTLPTNAYATLEHEHVLLFRNGDTRSFEPNDPDRYASAFFWEERNEWFSDCWEVRGTSQPLEGADAERDRSGAFPLEIPLRLVRMYSIRGDTVLDPFAGTGTTPLAALCSARSSIGIERDPQLAGTFEPRLENAEDRSRRLTEERLDAHREFVAQRDEPPAYEATHYDTRVVTKSERDIRLSVVSDLEIEAAAGVDGGPAVRAVASHEPF